MSLRRAAASLVIAWVVACGGDDTPEARGSGPVAGTDSSAAAGGAGAAAPSAGDTATGGQAEAGGSAGQASEPPAAGSAGSPATGGSGGAQAPATPDTFESGEKLDPDVTFEWPESPPGDGTECPAGTYTGSFECTFTDANGLLAPIVLTGPVSLTFEQSADGEFLEITDGDFAAVANLVVGARAQIQGRLDCSTLMLDAMAVDGMWAIGDPDLPLIPGGGLEGAITGTLDPATGELSGEWTFGDPALGDCPGTWSVTYVP